MRNDYKIFPFLIKINKNRVDMGGKLGYNEQSSRRSLAASDLMISLVRKIILYQSTKGYYNKVENRKALIPFARMGLSFLNKKTF